jgi:sugar/nucleoside kinase (ribokinase family)
MTNPNAIFDVLGLGCTAVDDVLYIPSFPVEDGKVRVQRRVRRFGGLTGAALVAAARLGARCAYAGQFGLDELSQSVRANFIREGIDVSRALCLEEARVIHSTIVVAQDSGRRNIFYDCNGCVGAHPALPAPDFIRAARVLLIDHYGLEGTLRAARLARADRIAVVADFEEDRVKGIQELMALVDHLVVPASFACRISHAATPEAAAAALWHRDRAAVVVTCGADGCWTVSSQTGGPRHHPAFAVRASDTTGCGDVFHGAYAAALARGEALETRIRFASAAAALKAGQQEIPHLAEVLELIAQTDRPQPSRTGP